MKRTIAIVGTALLFAACGGEDGPDDNAHQTNGENHANHENQVANNAATGDVDTYSDGLMKHGHEGNFMVMLMTAEPAPPDVGENTWTLRVMDMDENPIAGAKVTVSPFMPAHGHGTSPADYSATFDEEAGTYEVGPFDLFMPGVWETTIKIDADGTTDMVKYSFELEG